MMPIVSASDPLLTQELDASDPSPQEISNPATTRPFQHQEPAQEHGAIEKEIIGTSATTGRIDAPRTATDVMASLVAGAPVSGRDVPFA